MDVVIVAIGSALGGVARYLASIAVLRWTGPEFPYGTVAINVVGSFVIGVAAALSMPGERYDGAAWVRLFIMVGICGGFTTFSSFSLQTVQLLRAGRAGLALVNVAASVLLCLVGTIAGYAAAGKA